MISVMMSILALEGSKSQDSFFTAMHKTQKSDEKAFLWHGTFKSLVGNTKVFL